MANPFYSKVLITDKELLEKMFKYFSTLNWTVDTYIIRGNPVTPKRKTFMYGVDYSYSGIIKKAKPFDKQILFLSRLVEKELGLEKNYFNACLLNLYPDGNAGLSYHKDDEKSLDSAAPIVSFSLGATRKFFLKRDSTRELVKLSHKEGEILIMDVGTQEAWTHSIPKEPKIEEARISFTFRRFL